MRNENGMMVFLAEEEQVEQIRSLLLPEAYQAWKRGEDMLILGLVKEKTAVGVLAAVLEGETFSIVSLYVAPQYRRQGGGRLLMNQFLLIAEDVAERAEADFIGTEEEHGILELFLAVSGFREEELYGEIYALQLGQLSQVPVFRKEMKSAGTPLRELGPLEKRRLEQEISATDAPYEEGMLTDESMEEDISRIHFTNKVPDGFVLCQNRGKGGLMITGAWNGSGLPLLFLTLLHSAFAEAEKKYPPQTRIAVQAVNATTGKLIRELMPQADRISHCYVREL